MGTVDPDLDVHPPEAAVTGLQDHLVNAADQGSEALAGAARVWAQSVQRLASPLRTPAADPTAMVDVVFDLAEQVLATQRALIKAVLRAVVP